MDELQRQMLEIARSVAGGARPPGPMAARRRGRQLRRRGQALGIATVALVVGALPVARWAGVPPSSTTAAPPPSSVAPVDGMGPLTPERYLPFASPGARWLGPIEVVASGEQLGRRWRVVAYRLTNANGAILACANYEHEGLPVPPESKAGSAPGSIPGSTSPSTVGPAPGPSRSSDLWLLAMNHSCDPDSARVLWSFRTSARETMLAGMVTKRAATVRLNFRDGSHKDTPVVPGSDSFDIDFFALVLPFDASERADSFEALTEDGRALCAFPPSSLPRAERSKVDWTHVAGGAFDCPDAPLPR